MPALEVLINNFPEGGTIKVNGVNILPPTPTPVPDTVILTPSGSNDYSQIQTAINNISIEKTLKLNGNFLSNNTILVKSGLKWILDGTLKLMDRADKILISDPPTGASNVKMQGGIYDGNKSKQTANAISDHVIRFFNTKNSNFTDMVCQNSVNDGFTLDTGCSGNICTHIIGKLAGTAYTGPGATNDGNGIADRGNNNTWIDCIAENNYSDSWVIKCRNSKFIRCIGRGSTQQVAFGLYADRNVSGNVFTDCRGNNNGTTAIVLNIPAKSQGKGYLIENNIFQGGEVDHNGNNGITLTNSTTDGLIRNNTFNLWSHDNASGYALKFGGTNLNGIKGNTGTIKLTGGDKLTSLAGNTFIGV